MKPLWLALHLPCLPLEASGPLPSPSAVIGQGHIVICDDAARRAGVKAGMGISVARALAPVIGLVQRDPAREEYALQSLACWAGGFTPRVSLAPGGLLLEISGCLRLFNGLDNLVAAAQKGVRSQGFSIQAAVAATPQAALWLAEAGTAGFCLDESTTHKRLEALSISMLPNRAAQLLQSFGARTLADVRKLPSAALVKRIGGDAINLIARAFGELPDLRPDFDFPDRFSRTLELPAPVETAAALLFAARRLTAALSGWLALRQAGIAECGLRLMHADAETLLSLRFADITRDNERLLLVLRETLERITLKAPVEGMRLEAVNVESLPGRNASLFADGGAVQQAMTGLLERLRARLGEDRVHGIALHADHRPECATRSVPHGSSAGSLHGGLRPFWLMTKPESLPVVDGRPHRRGPLKLLAGPERIESGWWDSGEAVGDIRRDYFIALSADMRWLWVYRECRAPSGWFLHGFFA